MDNRGYASRIVRANLDADVKSPGVKLGVSRMTIYKWFTGEWIPRKAHEEKIGDMLKKVGVV